MQLPGLRARSGRFVPTLLTCHVERSSRHRFSSDSSVRSATFSIRRFRGTRVHLIQRGVVDWPHGSRFVRFGNPDGGREGIGVLPNGDVWAWQAKYLFEFDSSAAGQVSSSVRRVLGREPNLKRYFIALPLDMPAGDTEDRTSAYTRWEGKVSEWEALANEKGLEVEFVFMGAHQPRRTVAPSGGN